MTETNNSSNKNHPVNETSPKERIFQAAIKLFAQKGFAATGVREIAKKAQVNVAMISYFFGSKQGLLEAVLEEYFTNFLEVVEKTTGKNTVLNAHELDDVYRSFIYQIVKFYSKNPDLVRIMLTEMPFGSSPSAEIKAAWWKSMIQRFKELLVDIVDPTANPEEILGIVGPALNSAMGSHFLLWPIIEKIGAVQKDEGFYARYAMIISEFCLHGLNGVVKKYGTSEGQKILKSTKDLESLISKEIDE